VDLWEGEIFEPPQPPMEVARMPLGWLKGAALLMVVAIFPPFSGVGH
jgi:hypothetical protein